MKKAKEKQIKALRNYIEKAINKADEIEVSPLDNRMDRISGELIKVLSIVDEYLCQ